MPLYHKDVFVPHNVIRRLPIGWFRLRYGIHAKRAANLRFLPILSGLDTYKAEPIEFEVVNGQTRKIVFRTPINNDLHLSLAIDVTCRPWFVKTVWHNLASDQHKTLDRSRYARS